MEDGSLGLTSSYLPANVLSVIDLGVALVFPNSRNHPCQGPDADAIVIISQVRINDTDGRQSAQNVPCLATVGRIFQLNLVDICRYVADTP